MTIRRVALLGLVYVAIVLYYYFAQDGLIFHPRKLEPEFVYAASVPVDEHFIPMADGIRLNAVLAHAPASKGVVFYLHGNAGSLKNWITRERDFTKYGYDFFAVDYRGYGKSGGRVSSQGQFYNDADRVYRWLLDRYSEEHTIVVGFSIGSGAASHVACRHAPRALILKAPFYSMVELASRVVPFVPSFILKYPFPLHEDLAKCRVPITIIHGDQDRIIPFEMSQRLSHLLKPSDTFVVATGMGHNDLPASPSYETAIRDVLNR